MAFRTYNNFYNILKKIASSQNSERFIAENFILEERLQKERQRAYMKNISDTCEEFGKWQSEHDNYLYRKIYIEHDKNEQPETFTNINGGNILNEIDENQYLVRLEDINSAIDLTDFLDNENRLSDILKLVSETGKLPSGNEQIQTLRDFFTSWNSKRDKRPIFAGFWGEIKDIFDNDDNNWANRLRDRLGIGHYDPEQWGENIPVLLLRYRVSEVLKYENRNKFSIPTVIDSGFSECFVPTSAASEEGQTLNLGVTDETAYYFNKEILHSFIEYKAEHIYRIGEIDAPPVGKCEEIRNFHLNLIGNRLKNIKEIRQKRPLQNAENGQNRKLCRELQKIIYIIRAIPMENTNKDKKSRSRNPYVIKWEEDFEKEPLISLDNLLSRRVYMGPLNRNTLSEILFRIFNTRETNSLDTALCGWLKKYWGKVPSSMPVSRWADMLSQVFIVINRLRLARSYNLALGNYLAERTWLKNIYKGSSKDPEDSLLRMLARGQKDRKLMPLWFRIISMTEDMPRDYTSIAILGLRTMPEKDGSPPGDIDPLVLKGFLRLAEALQKNGSNLKAAKEFWRLKLSSIMGLYPRTEDYWIKAFLPMVRAEKNKIVVKWLNGVLPNFHKKLDSSDKAKKIIKRWYPNRAETDKILDALKKNPDKTDRLDTFMSKSISYAMETGDADDLVKAFHRIAGYFLKIDNIYMAEKLTQEAFLWEPYNPFLWIMKADIHKHKGEHKKAESILWKGKRKFPENGFIRSNLADHLFKSGELDLAEAVYRESIEDFPKDAVCMTGLAEVLKAEGKLDEAEGVYRESKKAFPRNAVCMTGLAEVLKAEGKFDEAEAEYRESKEAFPENAVCRNGLAEVLKAQGKLDEAEAEYRESKKAFPENAVCRNGLAEVLKAQGRLDEAEAEYRESIEAFPKDAVCRNGLATLLFEQDRLEESEKIYNELILMDSSNSKNYKRALNNILRLKEIEDRDERRDAIKVIKSSGHTEDTIYRVEEKDFSGYYFAESSSDLSEEEDIEIKIGRIKLYRGLGLSEKKEEYAEEAENALHNIKRRHSDNIFVIKEEAWRHSYSKSEEAERFFENKSEEYQNSLGLKIAELRHNHLIHNNGTKEKWNRLYKTFPKKRTVIALEQLIQQQNGYYDEKKSKELLDKIGKGIKNDPKNASDSNKKKEEWFCSHIRNNLFTDQYGDYFDHEFIREYLIDDEKKTNLLRLSETYIDADRQMRKKLKIAALISGSGTNLQAVIDSCLKKIINAEIVCVGSDRPDALGLKRAEKHNIPTFITDYKEIIRDKDIERRLPEDFDCEKILSLQRLFHKGEIEKKEFFLKTRAAAEADMLDKLSNFRFDLIILAGFMRKLTPYFIDKINTDSICPRIMNIHPSLLPAFAGTDGYKDTFEYGAKLGGCTVHFVDYGEDTGAVIGQRCFPIFPEDTLETVRTKGLSAEWELYTEAIKLFEERRLRLVKRSLTTSKGVNIEREIVEILERTV